MDLNLEIISEESDCPDPLFESIMNAMNSMKEATADKIYQKIQKDGETNYSKPQVGRALANALKYGIFEIRNNRYRVRDDTLDDEDTVYWKSPKKREQTPFRIEEGINDKQLGPKLNPEKDNQRFKPITSRTYRNHQCPHCGRVKNKTKTKKSANKRNRKGRRRALNKIRSKVHFKGKRFLTNKMHPKRMKKTTSEERCSKKRKLRGKKNHVQVTNDLMDTESGPQKESYNNSDSEIDLVSPLSNNQSFKSCSDESKNNYPNRDKKSQSLFSLECVDADEDKAKRSNTSLKFDSESDQMDVSSFSFDQSRPEDSFYESLPCTSRNANSKTRSQYLSSSEMYSNQYERNQTDQCQEHTNWPGCSDEQQGTIILSNNMLTIEPMDSLAFKSPEQATYIS